MQEALVRGVDRLADHASAILVLLLEDLDHDAGRSERLNRLAAEMRQRMSHADHAARDTGLEQRPDGRVVPVTVATFHVEVGGPTPRLIAGLPRGNHLGALAPLRPERPAVRMFFPPRLHRPRPRPRPRRGGDQNAALVRMRLRPRH